MRRARVFGIPLAGLTLFAVWTCSKPDEAFSPSFATGSCHLAFSYIGGSQLTVNPNSINNDAAWFITNDGTGPATITSQTLTKVGSVIAVRPITWANFPFTLPPGGRIDADVAFDVGASGIGKVGITIVGCSSSQALPLHLVSIQSGTAPTVTTKPASLIGTTTATLNGSANPNGATTSGWFRYATTNPGTCNDTFGTRVPITGGTALGAGSAAVAYSRPLTGLTVGQGYYFCAIAANTVTGVGTVRFFVPVRFAVGMFKGQISDMGVSQWTPDGKHLQVGGNIPSILASAQAAGSRIVMHVTRDNGLLAKADGTFDMAKWKADFNLVAGYGNALRPYVKNGTLIGHYAIDEPFQDFVNFQAADLEEMCRYQKLSWAFVPCIVRINNIKLDSVAPVGGYKFVDAGWAQLLDFSFDHAPFNGSFQAWYDSNLVAGRRSGLGLMYGFNLLQGGHEATPAPGGCALPPPSDPDNCAMTATEVRKMADAISALGPDQGCGDIGWALNRDPGPERDYYFGTGSYAGNGVLAALQYLWNKTAGVGLRPGLCNIRGDLPAP